MKALVSYISELCMSSRQQLAHYGNQNHAQNPMPVNVLHLFRLGDVMLRVLRSGRPLLHLMRLWSVVAPHLVEVSGKTLSASLALWEENPPVTGWFPSQKVSNADLWCGLLDQASYWRNWWWFEVPWCSCDINVMVSRIKIYTCIYIVFHCFSNRFGLI